MFTRVERWLLPERLEVLPILILAFNPHSPPRHKWATSSIFQAATGCGAQNFHIAIWGQPLPTRMFLFLKQDHSMAPPLRDMSSPGLIKPTSAIRWPSSLSLDIRLSGALSTLVPVLPCREHNPALTASSVLPTSTAFHTDITGSADSFASSSWVFGGAAVVGATYFFDRFWFLDFSYTYAATLVQTTGFSAPFSSSSFGYTDAGILSGTYSGRAITQSVALSINRVF